MAIRRDALVLQHGLSERQAKLIGLAMERKEMTIGDILLAYPDFKRRTVQRDLKELVEMGFLIVEGSTSALVYQMKP
jgi:predicted DNA-binding transcriptional regulator YafY